MVSGSHRKVGPRQAMATRFVLLDGSSPATPLKRIGDASPAGASYNAEATERACGVHASNAAAPPARWRGIIRQTATLIGLNSLPLRDLDDTSFGRRRQRTRAGTMGQLTDYMKKAHAGRAHMHTPINREEREVCAARETERSIRPLLLSSNGRCRAHVGIRRTLLLRPRG